MASERETFSLSGPLYLNAIDWRNSNHRRSIAASLVQSVYVLERDRQQNRQGPKALAPPWWEFFHFRLIQVLVDPEDQSDQSYFGAIYEYKFPNSYVNYFATHNVQNQNQNPPKYVIAFRGTITKQGSSCRSQDLKLDLKVIRNSLHNSSRFHIGLQAVQTIIHNNRGVSSDIWLVGHSLGSSISLIIGRYMAKTGIHLETYLFNPPFASLPIEKIIKNEKLKQGIRFAHSVLAAGLAVATRPKLTQNNNDTFTLLSSWIPYLFVNPLDPICSEYVGYFEHREKMVELGVGKIERIATQNSIRNIVSSARGKNPEPPSHLLPSAYVTNNLNPCPDFKRAHEIHQWWKLDLQCNYKLYQFL